MDHVAIMKKEWKLTQMILSGEKKIESRWYVNRSAPWGKITAGEAVYFKDSGEPVTIKAEVDEVLQFSGLNPAKVNEILCKYGGVGGINVSDAGKFFERFKNKRYCMLIFLKNPQNIEPFNISKKGFGLMAAWLCVPDINAIKI